MASGRSSSKHLPVADAWIDLHVAVGAYLFAGVDPLPEHDGAVGSVAQLLERVISIHPGRSVLVSSRECHFKLVQKLLSFHNL